MLYELSLYNTSLTGLGDFAAYSPGSASGVLSVIDAATAAPVAEGIRTRNNLGYPDIDRAHLITPGKIVDFLSVPVADQIALLQGAQSSNAFPKGVLTSSSAGDKTAVNKLVNRFKVPYGYSDMPYRNLAGQMVNFSVGSGGVTLTPTGGAPPVTPPIVVVPAPTPDPDSDTVWRLLGYPSKDAWRAAGKPPLPTSGPPAPTPTTPGPGTPPVVSAWSYCGQQNELCSFPGTARVRYGANGSYSEGIFTGGVSCGTNNTPGVFGFDPAPGVVKRCEWQPTSNAPTPTPPAPPAPPFIPPPAPPVTLAPDPDSDTVWRILGYPSKDAWRAAGKPPLPIPVSVSPPMIPVLPGSGGGGPIIPLAPGGATPPVVAATPTQAAGATPTADDGLIFGFPKQTVLLAGGALFALMLLKK